MTNSSISNYYIGKNVLITGATGFMGKVLVQKLLHDCCEISKIYILVRPKKGIDSEQRCLDYKNHIVFEKIRQEMPLQLDKIQMIKGDVTMDNLGLNSSDEKELIENVNIIFHCAANVRFDLTLKDATNFNLKGTLRVLTLAEKMQSLNSFVHVSTSYCNCDEVVLEEKYYPAKVDPFTVIEMIDTMSDDALKSVTPKLLGKLPNTYALTKGYSEDLVNSYRKKFPIVIARPPIVVASWKEPFPGFIEGVNGPTGLMIGAAKGVIRSMHCNPKYPSEAIPVDIIINCLIALAFKRSLIKNEEVFYCNITDSGTNSLTWGESLELGKKIFYKYPLSTTCLYYPNGSMKSNYFLHTLCIIFTHYLPAYIIDGILYIFGYETFLVNIQKRISQGLKVLQYYTTREWLFKNENFRKLRDDMNAIDQQRFYCDLSKIDYNDYILNYILGIRKFILNESLSSLPKARAKLMRLYYIDKLLKIFFCGLIIYIIYNLLK
ncbi:hypothetical protein PVAND_011878 [Polypedilum vanderplanki]|uniref:Fatty acyl-CoA reductase n=1 Tax=Polypedilum vanderplanki TaxID=319348 RepID=A0A9J6CLK8_POLVA|nr:hypothetical protein PVAND_011878 [Polypedilum vanderplanki]